MKRILLLIFICCGSIAVSNAQLITIAAARAMATGSVVTVRGVVLNGGELAGASTRYIYDGTGGLVIYGSNMSTLNRGDSVEATGTVAPYNNLFELNPVTTITVISTGNTLPTPSVQTIPSGFAESFEAHLVRFNNVTFTGSGTFAGNTNYSITDGTNTATIRIPNGNSLIGTSIPGGNVNVVGIMSQFSTTYQLLPRDLNDFPTTGTPPVFTSGLKQTNIAQTSFTVSFTTQNPGNTIIQYGLTSALGQVASSATMTTNHSINLTGLTAATIYYVKGITVSATNDTSFTTISLMATASNSTGNIKVYFDRSVDTSVATIQNAIQLNNACDDTLIAYIGRAQHTLDIAIYNLDNNLNVVTALNNAYNNGVAVRVVADNGVNSTGWAALNIGTNNKKVSPTGATYGIMHNKFMIIDANDANPNVPILWTGSMNWTDQQLTQDRNNIVIFQDQTIARAYEIEFNEMFSSNIFGPNKADNTPHEFNIGGKQVEVYFSPSDNSEQHIKDAALSGNYDEEFCLYVMTRTQLAYGISDAVNNNGAHAYGIIGDTAAGTAAWNILSAAMPGTLFKFSGTYLLHHKYLIVDANLPSSDPQVVTGSHNWSTAAQTKNDENTVVIHDANIANQFYQEFVSRYHDEGGTTLPAYMGLNDPNELRTSASLYPNPNDGQFTIMFETEKISPYTFTITDVTGRIIYTAKMNSVSGINKFSFNQDLLNNGIYFLHVNDGKTSVTEKFFVSK